MFCALGPILGGSDNVGCRFHVLRSRIIFDDIEGASPFFMFSAPNSFWVVPRASSCVFIFCASRLIFDGTEGAGCSFPGLRSQTQLGLYRWRRAPFSYFVLPNPSWAVSMAPGPVFLVCAPKPVLGGTESTGSNFHVLW
jgi:hypothetical protein